MTKRTKIAVFGLTYFVGATLSSVLLIGCVAGHSPTGLDFVVVVLLGLFFTTGLSIFNGIEAGIPVFMLCILLGVAQPLFEQWKTTFPFDSIYIALLVSFITSRVLYHCNRLEERVMPPQELHISSNEQGFDLIDLKTKIPVRTVTFAKVSRINAFKRDLFSTDLICLVFYQDESELPIEINEEMEGFEQLGNRLPGIFSGFDEGWYAKVVKPAFATNLTEVWKRDSG